MRFNRVPSSYYLFDLKDPAIEEDVDSRVYGRMILLRCDSDLEFRDLVLQQKEYEMMRLLLLVLGNLLFLHML